MFKELASKIGAGVNSTIGTGVVGVSAIEVTDRVATSLGSNPADPNGWIEALTQIVIAVFTLIRLFKKNKGDKSKQG